MESIAWHVTDIIFCLKLVNLYTPNFVYVKKIVQVSQT